MNLTTDTAIDPIANKKLVIATDLDGTFLGGTETARQGLYRWIEQNREQVGLIFVTGREPRFVRDLCRSGKVPRPDFVVGDVGTTVARMEKELLLAPIAELEEEIASAWGDAGNRVQAKLRGVAGLTAQSTGFRYRMSYDMDPARFDNRALDIVAEMGLDALISDNRFFDVLPKGVSKGPSLLRLLTHLEVDSRRVLVAGDTLNDLSMLELGLPAVMVGNSETALVEKLTGRDHVYHAKGEGAEGIAEAILQFDFFGKKAA